MNQRTLLGAALLAASFATYAADHAPWGYEGHGGADHWGELDPSFKTCKVGKEQSPINIASAKKSAALQPIAFNYTGSGAEVINNGHTIQVNVSNGSAIKLDGEEFKLLQFHFHTPSEEQINGRRFPMVVHLVHKSAAGKLAVVAVLLQLGEENAALKSVFDAIPAQAGTAKPLATGFNAAAMLPQDRAYYTFKGSLTTPPCSEGVLWLVLKQPISISVAQFAAFKSIYPMNARPVQPLHGRKVQVSQ